MGEPIQDASKNITKERSKAYPAISLEDAVSFSKKLIETYPKSAFDRESAAKAMGYSAITGASAPKVAALVHYGLIDRTGNSYRNSTLAQRIHNHLSEEERLGALKEAVTNPTLFSNLISEYSEAAVPQTLNNVLVRQHGISAKVADKIVEIFKKSVEFAGIYSNGIITILNTPILKKEDTQEKRANKVDKIATSLPIELNTAINITLPSGALISYPSEYAFYLQTNPEYIEALNKLEKVVSEAKEKLKP